MFAWFAFLASQNLISHVISLMFFVVCCFINVIEVAQVVNWRKYLNPFSRTWLHMAYRMDENQLVLVAPNGEERGYNWDRLSIIWRFPYIGDGLLFGTNARVFVGKLVGRSIEATGPLAKAIRDAVRRHGKGDLLIPFEKWERKNISNYNDIPRRRLYLYAQTPAFSLFLIAAMSWLFDGATTAFYNYLLYGAITIPVMALLTWMYRKRTMKAVARFQKQLDEDKAGSTPLSDEK